jgi:hypothetical protein
MSVPIQNYMVVGSDVVAPEWCDNDFTVRYPPSGYLKFLNRNSDLDLSFPLKL